MQNNLKTPAIFNIQHCCTQDGPGLRSIVFVKGCPLRCQWCQNPESWMSEPEIGFKADKCLGCGQCVKLCPSGSISKPGQKTNEKCSGCGICSDVCPSGAIVKFGEYLSPKELVAKLAPEFPYFRRTGGGVTFSGGEAGLYSEFIAETASLLKSQGIHTAMETCGLWACKNGSDIFNGMVSNLDMILFDIKLFDDEAHRKYCGSSNISIKDRFILLSDLENKGDGPMLWPRLPLIPGVTDSCANIAGWAGFLEACGINRISIVPYHELGNSKRKWMNPESSASTEAPVFTEVTEENIERVKDLFESSGIEAYLPGFEVFEEEFAA
ncbi:glycyl-radical enzyme activating protein [Desulforegula conservatrix]|uniref:glycyl-radical enzyme activating protein n=1 Tax=Desulforegula conservatrix TaxID=153026 RepID=UPI000688BE80|nr:glycyl-radical enzyme activating protein [Desulforegula conservatrix]